MTNREPAKCRCCLVNPANEDRRRDMCDECYDAVERYVRLRRANLLARAEARTASTKAKYCPPKETAK